MRNRPLFRKGFGIDTFMLFGFVVLPALVFIIFLIIEYWKVMRIDNNLKLIATMLTQKAVITNDTNRSNIFGEALLKKAALYCPSGTTLSQPTLGDNSEGMITVNVGYQFNGVFFKPKMQASMTNLSFYDLNLTADFECKKQ